MIAKMSQNIRHTNSTLKILGMAWTKAFTTTYKYTKHDILTQKKDYTQSYNLTADSTKI